MTLIDISQGSQSRAHNDAYEAEREQQGIPWDASIY